MMLRRLKVAIGYRPAIVHTRLAFKEEGWRSAG
jgi:hypothetical protein